MTSQHATSHTRAIVLTVGIVGLTLSTAFIHLSLGGLLFLLNAAGYLGLAGLIVIGAAVRLPIVRRFSWFPRLALLGYTTTTIVAYLVIGPYITLGWITKGIEVALLVLLALDVRRIYGGPRPMLSTAWSSVIWLWATVRRGRQAEWTQTPAQRRAEP